MKQLGKLGNNLRQARKKCFPQDDMKTFSLRVGVSRATLQKMEKGDLTVSLKYYYQAATLLHVTDQFSQLFTLEESLFDD